MSGHSSNMSVIDDNRAVSTVIGVVILFGFLILALSLYQVEIVPQQNAETEFQHSGEVRNDLIELRAGILQAGSIDQPQYQTVELGTTYSTRVFTINPPSPAGIIRTTDPYPITISNNSGTPEGTITIPTRFIEYQPGYNELDRSPTWYDASVLYLDARDEGGGIAVIEDQALIDGGEVQITALQNEFRRSGTGRVTLELRPAENVTSNIPNGDLTVTVPTRLSGDNWKNKTDLPTNSDIYGGVNDTGNDINNKNIYNLTLNTTANNLTVDTVGIQEEPEAPTQTDNTRIDGGGSGDSSDGTISTPSLTGTVENLPTDSTPTQNITFSPTGSTIPAGETVAIDLSNANGPVDYNNIGQITKNFSGSLNTVNNAGTFAIEFTPSTNIATGRTVEIQLQSVPTQDTVTTGLPVYVSRSDGDGFNTTFSLFDGANGGGGGGGQTSITYVSAFNDGDTTTEANEDSSIPTQQGPFGNIDNFDSMTVEDRNNARINTNYVNNELEQTIDVGMRVENIDTGSTYTLEFAYFFERNNVGQVNVAILDDSGTVLQSSSLDQSQTRSSTNSAPPETAIQLNTQASNYIDNNGEIYVEFRTPDNEKGYTQFLVDYLRIQTN
ncbi:hypothetical protein [Halorubrum trueperi]|uniref:Uncharacterized protein n=1 Tax=Halorubrum trueperi TaxID=2004704 RepID=A0ABD5UVQ9_9EURY